MSFSFFYFSLCRCLILLRIPSNGGEQKKRRKRKETTKKVMKFLFFSYEKKKREKVFRIKAHKRKENWDKRNCRY